MMERHGFYIGPNVRNLLGAEVRRAADDPTATSASSAFLKELKKPVEEQAVLVQLLLEAAQSHIRDVLSSQLVDCKSACQSEVECARLVGTLKQLATMVAGLRQLVAQTAVQLQMGSQEGSENAHPEAALARYLGSEFLRAGAKAGLPSFLYAFYLREITRQAEEGWDSGDAGMHQQQQGALLLWELSHTLRELELGHVLNQVLSEALSSYVDDHVKLMIDDSPNQSILQQALDYAGNAPLAFVHRVLGLNGGEITSWKGKLQQDVCSAVCDLRTSALFDLVIDYPDSLPALEDLRKCLSRTDACRQVVSVFGAAIRTRLLHPGAATSDIIHHYVSTIRSMRLIDPSGVVLDLVSIPLREYLRTRKDAIRCIVTMITEDDSEAEGAGFLAELEAENNGARDPGDDFWGATADELALAEIEHGTWEPPPLVLYGSPPPGSGDVISALVNIYGTKELFVTEYRSMLADRLLAKTDFDCDRELRTLELLKVRFGESALHAAEVMLRDLADSKRINANVRAMANTATPLKACRDLVPVDSLGVTIISELFWPAVQQQQEETCKLPPQVDAMMRTFGRKYHALKTPRVLKWKPALGTVSLTLTIGGADLEFNVSPLHAALLLCFEQRAEWGAGELSEAVGVGVDVVRRKLVYWINQGVVAEVRSEEGVLVVYRRNEELQHGSPGDGGMEIDDHGAGVAPDHDAMAHFEPFVMGMLTNFDALPLDRIHNMLKMFVTDPPYDRTIEQLSAFMGRLSTEDKVVLEGGVYLKSRK